VGGFFTPVPLDFDQAFMNGRLRPGAYLLGCHIAAESYRNKNTDAGRVTVYISALADLCKTSPPTIRRLLRALKEAGWLDFPEPEERQRRPWLITLTGLEYEPQTKGTASPTASQEPPLVTQSSERLTQSQEAQTPTPQAVSRPKPSTPRDAVAQSTDETRRDEPKSQRQTLYEGKLDQAEGEATSRARDPELEEALRPDQIEENPFPPSEGCELAEPLFDASIGTASLDEIRRRHESGEL
jgi:hypothetical protein